MEGKVRFEKDAIVELNKAKCFFETIGKEKQFLTDFENQISLIKAMPAAFQIRYKKVRIISFEHFSYTIHYTIKNRIIIILNVLNQYQNY